MSSNNQLQILKADARHASFFPQCVALVDRTQGTNVFAKDYFHQCISNPDRVLILAVLGDELIGVATARRLSSEGSSYYAPFGTEALALFQRNCVGSLECASVQESWQGRGVGRQLAQRRMTWLAEQGCNAIVGIAWESGLQHTSDRVFLRLGFERLAQAKDFYFGISVQRGFICPVCGPPPCRCSASLYVKK
jgi:GNAT superfamily N-acetyltransferase